MTQLMKSCSLIRRLLLISACLSITTGCEQNPIGPPPKAGYSTEVVTYKPKVSSAATRVELAHVTLEDGVPSEALSLPKKCPLGQEFVFSGSVTHPDTRILSVIVKVEYWTRGPSGVRLIVGGNSTVAKLVEKKLAYELSTKIPPSSDSRVFVEIGVFTMKPGFEFGQGTPEDWMIPIATGEIEVQQPSARK